MSDDDFPTYDAGLLAYWGGGDGGWRRDYIRQELNCAEDFYKKAHADGVAQLRAENERLRAALAPFAGVDCAEHPNDAGVPIEIDFTHEEAIALCEEIDRDKLPITKPGIDPNGPDAGMNWPRHCLSMDRLKLKHFRQARAALEGKDAP